MKKIDMQYQPKVTANIYNVFQAQKLDINRLNEKEHIRKFQ